MADVYDVEAYADTFYEAAIADPQQVAEFSLAMNKFLIDHDIEKWSAAFLDASWTHEVIRQRKVLITVALRLFIDSFLSFR